MPQLANFYGIVIYLYYFDHNPPHFHARYGNYEIVISILDFTVLYGSLPNRAYSMVMEWASLHSKKLINNWENVQNGLEPKPIAPLK